jgi:hypothetical protein
MELGALHYATADWDEVEPAAACALDGSPPIRCSALTVIGRTRLRRGEPGAMETLSGRNWRTGWAARSGTNDPGQPGRAHRTPG